MRTLTSAIDGLDQRAANHFGIGRTDLQVIDVLRSAGPTTASRLARSVGLTSGGLSIALDRLERVGYVSRSRHPEDRRSVVVEATDAVVPLEAEVFGALRERMVELLDSYTDEQLATITRYLERAAEVIGEAGTEVRGEAASAQLGQAPA